jgi:uncharacterized oxidoreductase
MLRAEETMKLTGNSIVVTGGTSGIGRELVERFLAMGNKVVTCGRRKDRLDQLQAGHPELSVFTCDVTDEAQRTKFADWVKANHPATNVLVNNAGVQLVMDFTRSLDLGRVRNEVETNFIAPVHFASLFAPILAKKEGAAIVNISSGLAFSPLAFMPVYCATKAAIHSLSLSLRHQMRALGITVYEIAPPAVDSELGRERWPKGQSSHGGMPVAEFVQAMLGALEADQHEAAIGQAEGMKAKREALFDTMNH